MRFNTRCNKSGLIASAHIDRQLTRNEASNYLAHIETCADCRTYLAELEQVSLILKTARRPDVSPRLRSYVMSAITDE
jgi:hypothetical protein